MPAKAKKSGVKRGRPTNVQVLMTMVQDLTSKVDRLESLLTARGPNQSGPSIQEIAISAAHGNKQSERRLQEYIKAEMDKGRAHKEILAEIRQYN